MHSYLLCLHSWASLELIKRVCGGEEGGGGGGAAIDIDSTQDFLTHKIILYALDIMITHKASFS